MSREKIAYAGPFVTFLCFTGVCGLLEERHIALLGHPVMYVLYPVQTVVCGVMLGWFWNEYRLRAPGRAWLAVLVGVLMFVAWIALPAVWQKGARVDGFNPGVFAGTPAIYWGEVGMRFVRLALVVPVLEEVFWRGFLLRYLIEEDFTHVAFGRYTRMSNVAVAIGFTLEHSYADWPAALLTGLAYNMVAYQTRSLSSCVLAHAVTNLALGVFIMATHQWGYW